MSIQQTKKQSDLEKRLRLIRAQVYGKISLQNSTSHITPPASESSTSSRSDITYLRQDLFKIGALASVAFGVQIILYIILQNNILKLNLF